MIKGVHHVVHQVECLYRGALLGGILCKCGKDRLVGRTVRPEPACGMVPSLRGIADKRTWSEVACSAFMRLWSEV